MRNIVSVLIVRCTHTGVYADGRPNTASVTIYDLDEITIQKNRTRYVPIPPNSTVDIPMSTRTFVSWHEGSICQLARLGLIRTEIILQLRDKEHCGGPAGVGQTLRPGVLNIERVGGLLRMVIPNVNPPTNVDSAGYLVGEPIEVTGLVGAFRDLNGEYEILSVAMGTGLGGADPGSYLVVVPSSGPDIAAAIHPAGVLLCLTEGRVTVQFESDGDLSGFGTNIFGYVAGQLLPFSGGGGGAISIEDEGILIEPAATLLNFVGAGVTASSTGPGSVDVTIPGGGGAPTNAEYVVMSLNPTLTDERVLTAGTGLSLADGGAGGNATLSVISTLAQILSNGNTTGGTDILVSTGDVIAGVTDLVLSPGGGGGDNVIIDGLTWPSADGAANQAIITNGAGVLSFGNPTPALHASTHVHAATDEIDGDLLDIDFVPVNYTRTLTPPTTSLEELTSHLNGIDIALGAATAVLAWGNASVAASTATRYLSPWWEDSTAPLAPLQWRVPRAGTLRNMRVRHNSLVGNGNAIVYTLRVNGVATLLAVSLASTAADGSDLVDSVVVAAGDLIDIEVTKALSIGAGGVDVAASMEFAA